MKQTFARVGGLALVVAVLAACSANQALTPATSSQALGRPAASLVQNPHQIVAVTADNVALAQTFQLGKPKIFYTKLNNPFGKTPRNTASAPVGYPLDMACASYGGTCQTMPSSTAYNIYVSPDGKKCTDESCWGDPEEFLAALTGSTLSGLITQYTGGKGSAYTYGGSLSVVYSSLKYSKIFYGNDLGTILAAAVAHFGATGTKSEYHLFLPPGYDTCFDESAVCYSPDNLSAFGFCAYHDSAYIPALKSTVIFSVEPWAGAKVKIKGKYYFACGNSSPSVKPSLDNFQASILAHESFESWSDPVVNPVPYGYYNRAYGEEIGDVCAYQYFNTVSSKSTSWNVQNMYSNESHGCASQ